MAARPEGNRKLKNHRRPGDPVVRQSHGLAIAVPLPEHQASHLRVTSSITTMRPVMLINHVNLLHLGQCYGFLEGSILVTLGA